MNVERAREFTLRRIIFPDMALNYFLAAVLLAIPGVIDDIIGSAPILPPLIYRIMGLMFLGFAAWQTWVVRRNIIAEPGLIFAGLLAEGPVIALTLALLFWNVPIYPIPRILLWIGNIYMLFLGAWYFALAYWISKQRKELRAT
jgi:hypothetical protein